MEKNNNEIEFRGKILTLSLYVEESLNRILYNFFAQKSKDRDTSTIFLQNFILPTTFGQKLNLYKQILKTGRYQKKVMSKLEIVEDFPVKDISNFINLVQRNLSEILVMRNYVAHGMDVTNGFLTLTDSEMVILKKNQILKISKVSIDEFHEMVYETILLLDITYGILND